MTSLSDPSSSARLPKGIIFASLAGLYLVAYFYRVSAAVIAGDLERDLVLSSAELGSVSAALFYAFAVAQIPLGPLLDRFGARKILLACGAITTAGAVIFALAEGYGGAVLGRILIGAGTASVLMGSLKVYSTCYASHRFATLAGWQIAIGNSGNLLATAPLAWVVSIGGWRWSFAAVALVTTLAVAVVGVALRAVPPPVAQPVSAQRLEGWRTLAREGRFWAMALLAFFWYGSYMAVQGLWGGPYLEVCLGLNALQGGKLLMLTAVGFIVGCPLAGYLADRGRVSARQLIIAGQLGMVLTLALFVFGLGWLPPTLLSGLFFFFGLCVSTGPILYTLVKRLYPPQMVGTALTSVNFFVVIGAALLQQVMGWLLQGQGGGETAYRIAYALPLAGLAAAILVFILTTMPPGNGENDLKTGRDKV